MLCAVKYGNGMWCDWTEPNRTNWPTNWSVMLLVSGGWVSVCVCPMIWFDNWKGPSSVYSILLEMCRYRFLSHNNIMLCSCSSFINITVLFSRVLPRWFKSRFPYFFRTYKPLLPGSPTTTLRMVHDVQYCTKHKKILSLSIVLQKSILTLWASCEEPYFDEFWFYEQAEGFHT